MKINLISFVVKLSPSPSNHIRLVFGLFALGELIRAIYGSTHPSCVSQKKFRINSELFNPSTISLCFVELQCGVWQCVWVCSTSWLNVTESEWIKCDIFLHLKNSLRSTDNELQWNYELCESWVIKSWQYDNPRISEWKRKNGCFTVNSEFNFNSVCVW